MTDYTVKINTDEEDHFELEGNNVGRVLVLNKLGNDVTPKCRVQIELSQNALFGLGTELIRLAHEFQNGRHTHIHPVDKDLISQNMGIYLTSNSCELIINCTNFEAIEKYTK